MRTSRWYSLVEKHSNSIDDDTKRPTQLIKKLGESHGILRLPVLCRSFLAGRLLME